MATPNISLEELQTLGKARPDDLIDWHNEQELLKRMAWLKAARMAIESKDDGKLPSNQLAQWAINLADKGIGAAQTPLKPVVPEQVGGIFSRMKSYLARNFQKGVINISEGRKKRKYGIMFAGMGAGAIAGALIGTLVFPGLGTAVGGTVGAAIAAASPVVLGVITGVVGAFLGTFASKKIAKKMAKGEDSYQLYRQPTNALKKLTGLDETELTKLHAYIKNREGHLPKDSPLCQALEQLRTQAFKQGSKTAFEQLCYFLAQELTEMKAMPSTERAQDLKVIQKCMQKLKKSDQLDPKVREEIKSTLNPEASKATEEKPQPPAQEISRTISETIEADAPKQDHALRQAAEMLLKAEIERATNLTEVAQALERYQHHDFSLEDVRNQTLDIPNIIQRIYKCDADHKSGNRSPKLGKLPYVHDKYGLRQKVENLLQSNVKEEKKVSIIQAKNKK